MSRRSVTRIPYAQYIYGRQAGTVDELCFRVWQLLEFYPVHCVRQALDELQPTVLIRSRAQEDVPTLSCTDLRRVEERAGGMDISGVLPEGVLLAQEPTTQYPVPVRA